MTDTTDTVTIPAAEYAELLRDRAAADHLAALLGTQEEWNGGDVCESAATILNKGTNRPDMDNVHASAYRAAFEAATGRELPEDFASQS